MDRHRLPLTRIVAVLVVAIAALAGCGGGGTLSNEPLGNSSQKLSFVFFQKCIQPILLKQLTINVNGNVSSNTCAGSGCHDNATGTGGAFRVIPAAAVLSFDPSNTIAVSDTLRASDMFKNYISAQGETVLSDPLTSRLLAKPLVRNILHGGGQVFADTNDPDVKTILYWISHPVPLGQDEFSAVDSMFTPSTAVTDTASDTRTCNSQ